MMRSTIIMSRSSDHRQRSTKFGPNLGVDRLPRLGSVTAFPRNKGEPSPAIGFMLPAYPACVRSTSTDGQHDFERQPRLGADCVVIPILLHFLGVQVYQPSDSLIFATPSAGLCEARLLPIAHLKRARRYFTSLSATPGYLRPPDSFTYDLHGAINSDFTCEQVAHSDFGSHETHFLFHVSR